MRPMLTLLLSLALAGPALATDGVLEINQACAINTGCFAGDTAGFPVTITQSGSFRLTGNLIVPANISGIVLTADRATIDLNGFGLVGPVSCTGRGFELVCDSSNTGFGIDADTGHVTSAIVRNGFVQGIGIGIALWRESRVEEVTASENSVTGIATSDNSIIENCIATQNAQIGIAPGDGSVVSNNVSTGNGKWGFTISNASVVQGNVADVNGTYGMIAGSYNLIKDNSITRNKSGGIDFAVGSGKGLLISSNVISFNGGFQVINTTGGNRSGYERNVIYTAEPPNGNTVSGVVNMGHNLCDGSLTCP